MKITIKGREFDAELPALDLREDLVYSYGAKFKANRNGLPIQRLRAAMVALCLPEVPFGLRVALPNPREDLYAYGGEVYVALRGKGWTATDLVEGANQILPWIMGETFPREAEVETARGNSVGGG